MSFPIEDFERISDLDQMWLIEARMREEEEYRMWEEEQAEKERRPAEIVVLTPIPKADEVESNELPF